MSDIPADFRARVVLRAASRCEYCALSQIGQEAAFHVDHVTAQVLSSPTTSENLALACVSCSLRKWAKQIAIDPGSGDEAAIFNPRTQNWRDDFRWDGTTIVGLTATGRATVAALVVNRPLILAIREEEVIRGRHPPT